MSVHFFIAKRYLLSSKSHQLIQLISWISLVSVAVCTAALFVILSVFNGLQQFVTDHFNTFHADLELIPNEGKNFTLSEEQLERIRNIQGVAYVSEVYTDMAVMMYEDRQFIVHLKGVEPDYARLKRIDTTLLSGQFRLDYQGFPLAVVGVGVESRLHCGISEFVSNSLSVYYPDRTRRLNAGNPMQGMQVEQLTPVGCFGTATDYDADYVFVPISFVRRLTLHDNEMTSLEIRTDEKASLPKIRARIAEIVGDSIRVRDVFQQEEELYKVMRSEKWVIFAILSFILLIASFNMIGMMAILVLDKKKDLSVFYAMGADLPLIRKVFMTEGCLISGFGTLIGMSVGFLFCWMQKTFHLIRFGGEGYLLNYYPVDIHLWDVVCIFAVVLLITLPAMSVPVLRISHQLFRGTSRHE